MEIVLVVIDDDVNLEVVDEDVVAVVVVLIISVALKEFLKISLIN